MGPSGPHFEFIYFIGMSYESRIWYRFTFVHKGVFPKVLSNLNEKKIKTGY